MFLQGVIGSVVVNTATMGAAYVQTLGNLLNDPQAVSGVVCRFSSSGFGTTTHCYSLYAVLWSAEGHVILQLVAC